MIKKQFILLFICQLCLRALPSVAQENFVRVMEVHGEYFGRIQNHYAKTSEPLNQFSVGATVTAGSKFGGAFMEYDFRKVNVESLNVPGKKHIYIHEGFFGLRYYSMRPSFFLGKMAVRINGGAAIGLDLDLNFRALYMGGINFSPTRDLSGAGIHFIYRPMTVSNSGVSMNPSWSLRLSLAIGPSAN